MKKILMFITLIVFSIFLTLEFLLIKAKQDDKEPTNLTKISEVKKTPSPNQNLPENQPNSTSDQNLPDQSLQIQNAVNDQKPVLKKKINNKSKKLKDKKPSKSKNPSSKQLPENLNQISCNQANLNLNSKPKNPITLQSLKEDFLQSPFFNKEKSLYKTKGSYLGVDLLGTRMSYYGIYNQNPIWSEDVPGAVVVKKPTARGHNLGVGVNYKYAFNYNNFFIAPGAFFEQNSFTRAVRFYAEPGTTSKVNARTGVGVDLGYDYKRISPYITAGYSKIFYTNTSLAEYYCENSDTGVCRISSKRDGSSRNVYSGFGTKFRVNKDFSLNLEYNYQAFQQKASAYSLPNPEGATNNMRYKSRLDVVKLGASYNF